jgi:hypothetical protein
MMLRNLSGRRDTGRQEFASGVSVVAKTGDDQPQNSLKARSKSPRAWLLLSVLLLLLQAMKLRIESCDKQSQRSGSGNYSHPGRVLFSPLVAKPSNVLSLFVVLSSDVDVFEVRNALLSALGQNFVTCSVYKP